MEIDSIYSFDEILQFGLHDEHVLRVRAKAFIKGDKVYFFEEVSPKHLRLYSVINKKSFFL